jgi:hypothetical protein
MKPFGCERESRFALNQIQCEITLSEFEMSSIIAKFDGHIHLPPCISPPPPPPPHNQPYPPSHPRWPSLPTGLNECTSLHMEGAARSAWYVPSVNLHPSVSTL